jgi:hypothetical protein
VAPPKGEQRYMVIMDGSIMVGAERALVIKKLSRLFGTDAKDVESMLVGEPLLIKKNLSARRAHQYFRTISNAGAACHLEEFRATDAAGYVPVKKTDFPDSELVSGYSVKFTDDPDTNSVVRRSVEERIQQLNDTGQFQIDDLESRRHNDKIVFAGLIALIFSLLAAVYFII